MATTALGELFAGFHDAQIPPGAHALRIADVCDVSGSARPGSLFVAVPGTHRDGASFAADAVEHGAVAIVSERRLDLPVPVVVVPDARAALAHLAAAWHGFPVRGLYLVGITGTLGKTSVLAMLGSILAEAGIRAGSIGSLGITFAGESIDTGNTTPGILTLQRGLAGMKRRGAGVVAMEVTSHALQQQRVRGLRFDLGIFTNLRMLEHMEYHDTFDDYASTKLRFLEHLTSEAPLIYPAGDRAVKHSLRAHHGPRISCGGGPAWVNLRRDSMTLRGTRITLRIRRPLERLDGGCLDPFELPLQLRTIGRANTGNAALAAVAGLCVGAAPDAVQTALSRIQPPRRRLEVLRERGPTIIDDTVGHPDSISAVCEVVERVPHERVRTVFCIRGKRGADINCHDAEALVVWSKRLQMEPLHITSATDTADERNVVQDDEKEAFLSVLRRENIAHTHHERLEDAVDAVLRAVAPRDVVLLLGAQGMDAAAELVRRHPSMR